MGLRTRPSAACLSSCTAFLFLIANSFPGFLGRERTYRVDVAIDPPERQRRLVTLFRLVPSIPALIVSLVLGGAVVLLEGHPSVLERMRVAKAWRLREAAR